MKYLVLILLMAGAISGTLAQLPDYSATIKITWPKDPACYSGSQRGRPIIVNNTLCAENGSRLRGDHIYMLPNWRACWNHNLDSNTWKDMRDKRYFNCVRLLLYQPENFPDLALPLADQIRYTHIIDSIATHFGFYVIINYHVGCRTTWYDSVRVYEFFKQMTAHFRDSPNVIFQVQSEPLGGDPWPDVYARVHGATRWKETDRQLWIWKLIRQWAPDSPIILWEFMKQNVTGSYDMKRIVDAQPGITYGNSTHTVVGWHAYHNGYDTSKTRTMIDAYPSMMTEMQRTPPEFGTGNYGPDIAKLEAMGSSWITLAAFPYYDSHEPITETVTRGTQIPQPTGLLAPADGSVQSSGLVEFSWGAASGAVSYRLQVGTDEAMTHVVVDQAELTASTFSAQGLAAGSVYYWRVASRNSAGTSPWSAVWRFATGPDAMVRRNLLSNADFDAGTSAWIFYTNGTGSMQQVSPGYADGQAVSLIIAQSGNNTQLYQHNIPLESKATYRLSFAAYSNSGHGLDVVLLQHGSPYGNYGLNKRIALSTAWSVYSTEFTSTPSAAVSDGRLMFWLGSSAVSGDQYWIDRVVLEKIGTSASTPADVTPAAYALQQNYPNPFNPTTTIRYTLPQRSQARLTVFNLLGQQVAELVNGDLEAGNHEVRFDGSGLSSGVYLYRLAAGDFVQTKKLVITK